MGYYLPFLRPAVSLEGVSVTLSGLRILDEVSLSAPRGAVTGLIGPNGAGKTTVFNVISGFVHPDAGKVTVGGVARRHIKPHQLTSWGVARTLQGVGLFPSLTALDNVIQGGSIRTRSGLVADGLAMPWVDRQQNRLREQATEILTDLGIADVAERYPGELPYPIQKRVALARALISDPSLLLLDEPAGGIGAGDMQDLAQLIRNWVPDRSVLLVEHHMELVMEVCDFIWVLDAGQVIASGSPEEIRQNPAVLAAYLGEEADH